MWDYAYEPSELRPATGRGSCTLDLADKPLSYAGGDIISHFCEVSSTGVIHYDEFQQNQTLSAAVEKRDEVAGMAAKSPPAQDSISFGEIALSYLAMAARA